MRSVVPTLLTILAITLSAATARCDEALTTATLDNGVTVAVYWPRDAVVATPADAAVAVSAPPGKTLTRLLVLVGYQEAAASYVPTRPATATGTFPGGAGRALAAVYSPSWGLWPIAAFSDGPPPTVPGLAWPAVLGGDAQVMLPGPGKAVPFERPDEYDWVTCLFSAAQGSGGLQAVRFVVPLAVSRQDASLYVWAAAAGPGLPAAAKYIPVSLTARSTAPTAVAPAAPPLVTAPRNGEQVGPNVSVVGRATPGALIVIWTDVYKQKTGEFVERVPGIRNKTQPDGTFHFRVATPRIFLGEDTPLVYKLNVQQITAAGKSNPTVITLYPKPR